MTYGVTGVVQVLEYRYGRFSWTQQTCATNWVASETSQLQKPQKQHPLAASIMGIRWGQAFGCSALPLLHSGPKKKFQTSEQSENLLLQRRDGEKEGKGKKEKKLREFFSLSARYLHAHFILLRLSSAPKGHGLVCGADKEVLTIVIPIRQLSLPTLVDEH